MQHHKGVEERESEGEREGEDTKNPAYEAATVASAGLGPGQAEHQIGSTLAALWQMATIKKPFAAFSCATLQRNQKKSEREGEREGAEKRKTTAEAVAATYRKVCAIDATPPQGIKRSHLMPHTDPGSWTSTTPCPCPSLVPSLVLACSSPAVKLPNAWKQTSIEIEFNSKQF